MELLFGNRWDGGRLSGGGRGIRTPGTVSRTAVFKTACFNRSHIPPREYQSFYDVLVNVSEAGIRAINSGQIQELFSTESAATLNSSSTYE